MTVPAGLKSIHVSVPNLSARQRMSYSIFTLCASLYLLPFMRFLLQWTDEGTLVYGAARIVHGEVFARDFFEVIGPGSFYWLAMFFKLFGVTFVAARICLFLTSLGTGLLMYFLSRRVCRRYKVLPCILLASTYFGMIWPAISHHVDSNFFALLTVACLVLWQDRRQASQLLVAGGAAGATTCFLQPMGILLFIAILVWLWMQCHRRSASMSALYLVLAGYCGVLGIVLIYFLSQGALRDLVCANFLWPSRHYSAVNAVPYAQSILQYYWTNWIMSGVKWLVVMAPVLITPLLFVAALPALLPILGAWYKWGTVRQEILLYCLCGVAVWISEFHRKDIFHVVFGSPLLIILCIHFLAEYRGKVASLVLQTLSISAGCLACFNMFMVLTAHPITTRVGSVAMFRADPVLTFLCEHVARGEEVFVYPYRPMYYFLSGTTNPTRYSILMYDYNTASQFEDAVRALDHRRVRYVVWHTGLEAKGFRSLFPNAKRMRSDELIIEPYLESHYKLVEAEDGVRIMERKSEAHAD
jgi:4-amino-4-deoxy-L-arabinose transferase-like glycosyltransferase